MTIVQEVKKIIPSKLDDKAKAVYNRLKEETNNFDIEFLVVYTDLEKAVEQFVDVVKKKYPDAIRVVRKKEKPTPPPTPEPETDDKEVLEVIRDYRISETQAKRLVQLRRDASESKKESIDKMLDTLKKSEFYNARYTSKQNIDKNRTRDIQKDSNRGSLTAKDELNMTGKRYKRISKAGHKNQYGTTEGGKVYYEYRANRRDIDHKIELANGGALEGRFKKRFNKGGMIDLFVDYENIPPKIQEILDFYEEDFQDGRYDGLSKALKEVEANGYTFEYYLDGEAYGLRPKNVPLNHIKGYEDEEYSKGGGVGIPNADKMFHLPFELAVYVPSTTNVSDSISTTEMSKRVKETETYLAETFGGFTSSEKIGGYLSSKSTIVTEKVVPVTSFCSMEDFRKNKNKLINKLSVWAKAWGQEAIGFEFEGDLYYVPQKFKRGGTLKATYIPKDNIAEITTIFGQRIKGKDIIDGAYTKRKDIRNEPKVDRFMFEEEIYEYGKGGWVLYDEDSQEPIRTYKTESEARKNLYEYEGNGNIVEKSVWDKTYEPKVDRFMFEDEMYEYAKGGLVAYINGNYDKKIANFSSLLEAKKFAKANKWKYDTIIFEDEIGDNIIVEKSDTFKDIDWLFSDKYDTGGKTPKNPKEPKMEDPMSNLKYGVKVIETIGGRRNEIIVAMFQEKFERDAYLRKRQERVEARVIATRRELPNYDYELIPINPY